MPKIAFVLAGLQASTYTTVGLVSESQEPLSVGFWILAAVLGSMAAALNGANSGGEKIRHPRVYATAMMAGIIVSSAVTLMCYGLTGNDLLSLGLGSFVALAAPKIVEDPFYLIKLVTALIAGVVNAVKGKN